MQSTIRKICVGWVLVCALMVRAEFAHGMSDGSVTDVGPEGGITTAGPQSFLFHGPDEILTLAGRSGIYKSTNRGESWVRSKGGLIVPGLVEPVIQHLCQSGAAREIAYVVSEFGVSQTTNFGDSWAPFTDLGKAGVVCAVDPSDPAVVYALTLFFKSSPRVGSSNRRMAGGASPPWELDCPMTTCRLLAWRSRQRIR